MESVRVPDAIDESYVSKDTPYSSTNDGREACVRAETRFLRARLEYSLRRGERTRLALALPEVLAATLPLDAVAAALGIHRCHA